MNDVLSIVKFIQLHFSSFSIVPSIYEAYIVPKMRCLWCLGRMLCFMISCQTGSIPTVRVYPDFSQFEGLPNKLAESFSSSDTVNRVSVWP